VDPQGVDPMSDRLYRRNSCFVRARDTKRGKKRIREELAQAPWLWPDPELDPDAWEAARAVDAGPGELHPGEVALVTVRDGAGSLWRFRVSEREGGVIFGPEGERAWRNAVTTLPRTLPFLWKSMNQYMSWVLRASKLVADNTETITGPSLGLALGLALASHVLERALPGDFIASATCDEYGVLGRVDGLGAKLTIIAQAAPGVREVFVAREQATEAVALCEELGLERVRVLGFAHLHEALVHSLSRDGEEGDISFVSTQADEAERIDRIDSLFRLAVGERSATIAWGPVARAAQAAREAWSDELESWQRDRLDFAAAVAMRHHNNRGELTMPRREWFLRLPRPTRIRVLAHIVQQAADTNTPGPIDDLLELALRNLPASDVLDAFDPQIQLMGSIGRLFWTARGNLEKAIEYEQQAANAWWRRWKHEEMSYPISALYTLCAIKAQIGDDLAEANALFSDTAHLEQLMEQGGERCRDNPYVSLSKARANLALGRTRDSEDALARILARERISDALRGNASRWLLSNDRVFNDAEAYARHRQNLDALAQHGTVAVDVCLLELTEAVRREDTTLAARHLGEFAELQPGLNTLLRGHAGLPGEDDPVALARFILARHPY